MSTFKPRKRVATSSLPSPPADRAKVIRLSLRAFVCGLFSIIPVLGLLPALAALACWLQVRRRYRGQWNPAAAYLSWGTSLALLGAGITAIGVPAVILAVGICNAQNGY